MWVDTNDRQYFNSAPRRVLWVGVLAFVVTFSVVPASAEMISQLELESAKQSIVSLDETSISVSQGFGDRLMDFGVDGTAGIHRKTPCPPPPAIAPFEQPPVEIPFDKVGLPVQSGGTGTRSNSSSGAGANSGSSSGFESSVANAILCWKTELFLLTLGGTFYPVEELYIPQALPFQLLRPPKVFRMIL